MRNIFAQYTQEENRVTHALMTALYEDRWLLDRFLRELIHVEPPCSARSLIVLEQQSPGQQTISEEDLERRGIPDAWIHDDDGWCVVIENKVTAPLMSEQLHRHRRTAKHKGFESITVVAITPHAVPDQPDDVMLLQWHSIYGWLRKHRQKSEWALRTLRYLEVAEARLVDKGRFREGTLTMFAGIPFGDSQQFNYLEAKRVLGFAMAELKQRPDLRSSLGVMRNAPGRPAITGKEGLVWDFLSLNGGGKDAKFTNHAHLSVGILPDQANAMVTLPHAMNGAGRKTLIALGEDGFRSLVGSIVANFDAVLGGYPGAIPWFRGVQRRYPSQRAQPFVDAKIEFDLRTAINGTDGPKTQPRWLEAAYGAFAEKEKTNYQIQVGAIFPYDRCEALKQPTAIDMIAASFVACKPLVEAAVGSRKFNGDKAVAWTAGKSA